MTPGVWCPKCEHQVWGICDKPLECENFVRKTRPASGASKEKAMTTTVKVHVNGKYRATVKQDGNDPVTVEGNYNGGSGEKSFYLPHPAKATFEISEEHVKDGDERGA
jgi:hypothetical protein